MSKCEAMTGPRGDMTRCESKSTFKESGRQLCGEHYVRPPLAYFDDEDETPLRIVPRAPTVEKQSRAPKSGKKQTRRSVSMRGLLYQRIRSYCDAHGLTVSGYIDGLVSAAMDEAGEPEQHVLNRYYRSKRLKDEGPAASGVEVW